MPKNEDIAPAAGHGGEDRSQVARGAGLAFLGRLGALIEIFTFFLFAYLFGDSTFGLFIYFWEAVFFIGAITDLGMTQALQRFVPSREDEAEKHRVIRYALLTSTAAGLAVAGLFTLAAPWIAPWINAGLDNPTKTNLIRIYAWAIPLWTFIDVATACIRARQVFGPEVRVRIFYEQSLRLVMGVVFFLIGWMVYGLFVAHLAALAITALFALRLLARYYDFRLIWRSGPSRHRLFWPLLHFSSVMLLPNLAKKGHSRFPAFFINAFIPGADGAAAVAYYALARKIVSALHVIRESFEYVLAPIASAKNTEAAYDSLRDVYAFSTRLILSLFIPVATAVVALRADLLGISGPQFLAGAGVLIILTVGRGLEAASGPSNAVISMIGRYRLPFLNALAGLGTTLALLAVLVPAYGITGAAVAAAVGINVTAYAGVIEVQMIYGLHPYSRKMIRPVAMASGLAALVYGFVIVAEPLHGALRFGLTLIILLGVIVAVLRFGLHGEDLESFRRKGAPVRAG